MTGKKTKRLKKTCKLKPSIDEAVALEKKSDGREDKNMSNKCDRKLRGREGG